jgi:hypothetical protein
VPRAGESASRSARIEASAVRCPRRSGGCRVATTGYSELTTSSYQRLRGDLHRHGFLVHHLPTDGPRIHVTGGGKERNSRGSSAHPPVGSIDATDRREFHDALLEADSFEDLPGKWQAAILRAKGDRPHLRVVSGD